MFLKYATSFLQGDGPTYHDVLGTISLGPEPLGIFVSLTLHDTAS
jgi:hypothetical protein